MFARLDFVFESRPVGLSPSYSVHLGYDSATTAMRVRQHPSRAGPATEERLLDVYHPNADVSLPHARVAPPTPFTELPTIFDFTVQRNLLTNGINYFSTEDFSLIDGAFYPSRRGR